MSKFENTRSQRLLFFNCHKQKLVKDSSLLEYLEKAETLEIKLQVVTQSRATATETAESPLLLDMPGRSHLQSLVFHTNIYLDYLIAFFWSKQLCFSSLKTRFWSRFHSDKEARRLGKGGQRKVLPNAAVSVLDFEQTWFNTGKQQARSKCLLQINHMRNLSPAMRLSGAFLWVFIKISRRDLILIQKEKLSDVLKIFVEW